MAKIDITYGQLSLSLSEATWVVHILYNPEDTSFTNDLHFSTLIAMVPVAMTQGANLVLSWSS